MIIAHPMFTCTNHHHQITFLFLLVLSHHPFSAAQPPPDEIQPLLQFKSFLNDPTSSLSNWNTSKPPCNPQAKHRALANNWVGIICKSGSVWALQLESMMLSGRLDLDSLTLLPGLRSISLTSNNFSGPLPAFSKLGALKSLFLSGNNFSGEIDDGAFGGMGVLKKVYMVNNRFTGPIPGSLAGLPKLLELGIEENGFAGPIPEFVSSDLRHLNLSYNQLTGRIPDGLNGFNSTSFLGNPDLCGVPVGKQCKPSSSSSTSFTPILIVITIILIIIITVGFLIQRCRSSNQYPATSDHLQPRHLSPEKSHKPPLVNGTNNHIDPNGYYTNYPSGYGTSQDHHDGSSSSQNNSRPPDFSTTGGRTLDRPSSYKRADNGKLCFLRNDTNKFEMQDLLKASAEVLGSGSFGSSYKAALPAGGVMVVKRFRQMNNVGREEFQEHMKKLGRLRHQNLLPIVAYFHKRDEKLLITEYVENGSLASHLHSNITPGQQGLSWPVRLRIIKGVARGLAYLYRELARQPLPHGHLKSSNVLLDDTYEPLLSDYGLSPLMNKDHAEQVMVAYKSPEFTTVNSTTKKTDVWCLGILILEVLTGKFPANYLKHGKGVSDDLATWVNSVVKEDWSSGGLFDGEMKQTRNAEGEMLKLLKIGMWCCEWSEEKRWGLRETVEKIEELKERDTEDDDEERFPTSNSRNLNDNGRNGDDEEEEDYVSGSDSSSVAIKGDDRLSFR